MVALKADKGLIPEAVKEILTELGNPGQLIPFYAVYGPAASNPITMKDAVITHSMVQKAIKDVSGDDVPATQAVAATAPAN